MYGLFQSFEITCPCVWGAIVSGLVRTSIFPSSMSLISCLISKHCQKNWKINVVLHVFRSAVLFACIQWFPFVFGSLKMVSKVYCKFVTYKSRHHRTCPVRLCLQTQLVQSSGSQQQAMTLWGHGNLNVISDKCHTQVMCVYNNTYIA